MVENNQKCIVTENKVQGIKEKIYELIEMHMNKEIDCAPDFNYEWNSIALRLNNILEGSD